MRLLHCYSGNLYGGIEAMLATLARCRHQAPALEPQFAVCFEGRLADELRSYGVPVHGLGAVRFGRPWTVLAARRRLQAVVAATRPDAVICHAPWTHAVLAPAVRPAGSAPARLVFWQHDHAGSGHWLERLAARTPPTLVVANSHGTAATTGRLFPGVPTEVLYCPVPPPEPLADPAAVRAALRRELDTPEDATVLIQASRLEPWKGHPLLLEALGRLRAVPGWVAWIAGGAQRPHERAYLEALQAQAAAAGIADRVRFLGQRADVPRLLAAADIHCQPNAAPEPFGVALVEALYAALPVVSVRMGGAAEIVTPACGALVAPGDAAGLAAALERLMTDPAERTRLGAAGPARAAALCDPAAALARLGAMLTPPGGVPRGGPAAVPPPPPRPSDLGVLR